MIIYKSDSEIRAIRKANEIVAKILCELGKKVRPGITTLSLDRFAEQKTREMGAIPAFKGYRGFPASLCTSLNEEIVHGIPSDRRLRDGDILSIDFGVILDGFYGDAAVTFPVGDIAPQAAKLIAAAEKSFYMGIEQAVPGKRIGDISAAVQAYVESQGFSVIRNFVGHGIGFSLHEEPQIPNFGVSGHGPQIKPGMVLAIEPMIALGHWEVEILADNWTAVTRDRSLSSHYEHTIAVTRDGPEILSVAGKKSGQSSHKEPLHA
jgi:methionyl aminopeptidase